MTGNAVARIPSTQNQLVTAEHAAAVRSALKNSLYPGAADASIEMVLAYCTAAGLDPMTKPVHIVPMWDSKAKQMRDVVMPGVGLYRTQASRTGQFAGMTEAEFGPNVTEKIGGVEITYPEWARVTVKRALSNSIVAEFTAREYWIENYAVKGGSEKSIAPNAMWMKRPRGQLAKCASAQALRIAFPELGAQATAEEMEGKAIDVDVIDITPQAVKMPQAKTAPNAPAQQPIEADAKHVDRSEPEAELEADDPNAAAGIFLDASPKKMLRAKGMQAGFNEEELVVKYGRIDSTNINGVLASLRSIAEAQE
jgi:phage recombination protein Bet